MPGSSPGFSRGGPRVFPNGGARSGFSAAPAPPPSEPDPGEGGAEAYVLSIGAAISYVL